MTLACLSANEVCRLTLQLQNTRGFHCAAIWRMESFRLSEGQVMTMRRALALNAVLDSCDLPSFPGELLLGSSMGRLADGGDGDLLRIAQTYLAAIGARDFLTNFDHAAPDYMTLLHQGIGGLIGEAQAAMRVYQQDSGRTLFLQSVVESLQGASRHVLRWAQHTSRLAATPSPWTTLLRTQAEMLTRLSTSPPHTFWEALQLIYLLHCVLQLDERYAMAFGRVDQFLWPFYRDDIASGRLTTEFAQTLLDHFIAKIAHGSDIQNICIGGVDAAGQDATNDLSFMLLEAVKRIGQPGGNLTARIHSATPEPFLRKCADVIRTGIGFPAVFNDEIEIPALESQGYPLLLARDYCFVGCIEAFIPGKQAPWSDSRFNLARCVNLALWNGYDNIALQQVGPHTGESRNWDEFYHAYRQQMSAGLSSHINDINALKQQADDHADNFTSPLFSALISDCLARGKDVCAGGAQYAANHGIGGLGIASVADSLMAVKQFVFEEQRFTFTQLRHMLSVNFAGYDAARQMLLQGAPKYGNDDDRVDAIARQVAEDFARECLRYRTPSDGLFWALLAANVQNISGGREVGATPDGRFAFQPLSDAASPTFGRDTHGPTAVVHSISKLDYALHPGGNVINMKFHPSTLDGEEGLAGLSALIRSCFALGGIQMQFNTTDRNTLLRAIDNPEDYAGLVVRVSGFSAYFTGLERTVQEDILARTDNML